MQSSTSSRNEITIQLDSEAAEAYRSASLDQKRKIQILLNAWLKEIMLKDKRSLKQLMDEISDKAQSRGLTPEILADILSG